MSPSSYQLAVATCVFLVCVGGAGWLVSVVQMQAVQLVEKTGALAQDQVQQVRLQQLEKTVAQTAAERTQVQSYYLQSQTDVIEFLNYVENLAAEGGVALETRDTTERDSATSDGAYIQTNYLITGTQLSVERFVALLELLPYATQVTEISLREEGGGAWVADVTIVAALTNDFYE